MSWYITVQWPGQNPVIFSTMQNMQLFSFKFNDNYNDLCRYKI